MAPLMLVPQRPRVVGRVVYGTITLTSVLIVYDGWSSLKLLDVVGVILGPILAMFIAHVFAANLAQQVALGRRLGRQEWVETARRESRFLLLAVPPLAVLTVSQLAGTALDASIRIIIWFGAASLGFWGGLAGHRAGFRGWRLVLAVVAGLLVGGVVLVLQVVLQPGKAVSGGVASSGPVVFLLT
jgi:hypothetical protein